MRRKLSKFRRSLKKRALSRRIVVDIFSALVGILFLTVFTITAYNYFQNTKAMMKLSNTIISQVTDKVSLTIDNYLHPAATIIEIGSRLAETTAFELSNLQQMESFALEVIKSYPHLKSFNIGDENGNFLMPRKFKDGSISTKIINRLASPPVEIWKKRNPLGGIAEITTSEKFDYDPRVRPWYISAKNKKALFWTDIYIFYTEKEPGITVAYPIYNKYQKFWGVFSIDISLGSISKFLKELKISKTGKVFILDNTNNVIAYPDEKQLLLQDKEGSLKSAKVHEFSDPLVEQVCLVNRKTHKESFTFKFNGVWYIGAIKSVPTILGKDWKIGVVAEANDYIGIVKQTQTIIIIFSLFILIIGMLIATFLARRISRPIVKITNEARNIKDFELDGKFILNSSIREIQHMTTAVRSMKRGLLAFRKYVPAEVVRQLIKTGQVASLGGEKKVLTVMFTDIENFTSITENYQVEKLFRQLTEYFDKLSQIIMKQRGTIDKYIGDAIMSFWGAPLINSDHAIDACKAALLCRNCVKQLNDKWAATNKPQLYTRFGIHTGQTIVGNYGAKERLNYSIIGDAVNIASRIEGVNKRYKTQILISESTYMCIKNTFLCRPIDLVTVKGKKDPVLVYELIDNLTATSKEEQKFYKQFSVAFKHFFSNNLKEAYTLFSQLAQQKPDDLITKDFLKRCQLKS